MLLLRSQGPEVPLSEDDVPASLRSVDTSVLRSSDSGPADIA